MCDQNENSNAEDQRIPRNLQGLLKFVMEATKQEDSTRRSQYDEMTAEDRKFIENALKSITLDVVGELNKAMKVLMTGKASREDQVESLEVVTTYAADIDTANDFLRSGGSCIVLPCLNSEYPEVVSATALLVGELAQNNKESQKRLFDQQILPRLVELLNDEPEVSSRAFHAISCLIRGYEPGIDAFMKMGGLECLLSFIKDTTGDKMITKSLFLISTFAGDSVKVRKDLIALDAIEKITVTLEPKDHFDARLEQTLSALISLVDGEEAIRRCCDENLKFKERMNEIISTANGKEDCQDLGNLSRALLRIISE